MKLPDFGFMRWFDRPLGKLQTGSADDARGTGLEPLEPRLLLSGSGLPSVQPTFTHGTETHRGADYGFYFPQQIHQREAGVISGQVFDDTDRDGLWDPSEYAMQYVTVFDDANGDGLLNNDEDSAQTNQQGIFELTGLSAGEHTVRMEMPEDYRRARWGSDAKKVQLDPAQGVGGLQLSVMQAVGRLEATFSDLSLPDDWKTGSQINVPVILTNDGPNTFRARSVNIEIYVSSDQSLDSEDILLTSKRLGRSLRPGQSIKLDISTRLPNALADFESYLLIRPSIVNTDTNVAHSLPAVATKQALGFEASDADPSFTPAQIDIVLPNWKASLPYGGLAPDYGYDGFVGIEDLNVVLGNWNAGTPPQAAVGSPSVSRIEFEHGHFVYGAPTTITAFVYEGWAPSVEQILFFYDADADGQLDDLLGVDTDGSDGYSVIVDVKPDRLISNQDLVVAIAATTDGKANAYTTEAMPGQIVDVSAGKPLRFRQQDGTLVTVSLVGPGQAQATLKINNGRAYDLGDVIEVTGEAELGDIRLVGTKGRSRLKITTSGDRSSDHAKLAVGSLTGSTQLGLLHAPDVKFSSIEMTGRGLIRSINVGTVRDITMGNPRYAQGVSIIADKVTGEVTLGSQLRLMDAGDLSNMRLTAPRAERILVRNHYKSGHITLTDADADRSLGLIDVKGRMHDVTVRAASSIGTVRANRLTHCSVAAGAWTDLLSTADVPSHGVVTRGTIQRFQARVVTNSRVSAWRLWSVNLDRIENKLQNHTVGLTYHRLQRYNGPDSVDRTVI